MTANAKQIIAAGFERMYYGPLNSTGRLLGGTATAPASGLTDGSPMLRMLGVKTSDLAIVEPEVQSSTGDDQSQGTFIFAPAANPSFNIEVAVRDLDFEALVQGTKVMAIGDISVGVLQPHDPEFPDIFLLGLRRAKVKTVGSDGIGGWEGVFIPRANLVPLGSNAYTERQVATYKYKVIANPCDRWPWGVAIDDATLGTTGGCIFPFTAENRLHAQRFTGDNTEDTFILAYTPISTVKTHVWVNDTLLSSGYAVTPSTKELVITVPPALNAVIEVLYDHAA